MHQKRKAKNQNCAWLLVATDRCCLKSQATRRRALHFARVPRPQVEGALPLASTTVCAPRPVLIRGLYDTAVDVNEFAVSSCARYSPDRAGRHRSGSAGRGSSSRAFWLLAGSVWDYATSFAASFSRNRSYLSYSQRVSWMWCSLNSTKSAERTRSRIANSSRGSSCSPVD